MSPFCAAQYKSWSVYGLPAFETNYIWVLLNSDTQQAIVVDPGCYNTVKQFVLSQKLLITHVLVTHHHQDHIGGLTELLHDKTISSEQTQVVATHTGRIKQATNTVKHDDTFSLYDFAVQTFEVPGHTLDHIAFYIPIQSAPNWLFCGDTLFSAGCGRLFEGTHEQMFKSLKTLAALPNNTLVFCAHEYTQANLEFLSSCEPKNETISNQLEHVKKIRKENKSTIPSQISDEKKYNLFFRAESVATFKKLRDAKDKFN